MNTEHFKYSQYMGIWEEGVQNFIQNLHNCYLVKENKVSL